MTDTPFPTGFIGGADFVPAPAAAPPGPVRATLRQPVMYDADVFNRFDVQLVQPLSVITVARVRQPIEYIGKATVRQPIVINDPTIVTHRQPFVARDTEQVIVTHQQPFSAVLTVRVRQPFGTEVLTRATVRQPFSSITTDLVRATLRQPFSAFIRATVRQPIGIAADQLVTALVRQPFEAISEDLVRARVRQPIGIITPQFQDFSGEVVVRIGTVSIPLQSAEVETDEDSVGWQCSVTLARLADYALFERDTAFTVDLYGDTWNFIVDSRRFQSRTDAEGRPVQEAQITGVSPVALQDSPRAVSISRSYPNPMMAQAIVIDLIGALTWNLVDWSIPANRFAVVDRSPLAGAIEIIESVGGILQSNPDGTLIARPRYPDRIPDYAITTPALTITRDDNYEASEGVGPQATFNCVQISDGTEDDFNDILVFIADDDTGLSGTLYAYPSPFDTNVTITTSRNQLINLTRVGVDIRAESQDSVEFIAGEAQVTYPVNTIISVEWCDTNLGGITASGNDLTSSINGYSLANIVYSTRAIKYLVSADEPIDAQFLHMRP